MRELLVFSATWCGPCKSYKEVLNSTVVPVAKVQIYDIDESMELAAKYAVRGVPTSILLVDGEIQARKSGGMTKDALLNFCNS